MRGEAWLSKLGNNYIATYQEPVPCPVCGKPAHSSRVEKDGVHWQHRIKRAMPGDKVRPTGTTIKYCIQTKSKT